MDVHLRDLRYFTAVAEELHFTRAAGRLYISQPALSKQTRSLERQLGFPLLERRAREVALTPQGEVLLPRARELVAAWEENPSGRPDGETSVPAHRGHADSGGP